MPTGLSAEAYLYPLTSWWPLAGALLAVQALTVFVVLRPRRAQWVRVSVALLAADVSLVVALRLCVAQMGRLDYSESFAVWRWWFLAAGLTLIGLPLPLWVLALRVSRVGQFPAGARPLLHPRFRATLLMWVLAGLVTLLLGADVTCWPRPARVTRFTVSVPNLPRALEGMRLAVLTDLHTGDLVRPEALQTRLWPLRDLKPDLLLVLGDVTYLDASYQPQAARLLQPYVVPGRSFAVAGNMDSGAGTDSLREELGKVGIRYLENESIRVPVRGSTLTIAGLGDAWTGNGDLARTLAHVPANAPVVLLSHSPDVLPEAVSRKVALVLSGHLHGGQIAFPFAGPAVGMSRFGTRFTSGAWRFQDTTLVVSRGLGEESLPLRLFCSPEVVVVTLQGGR